MNRFLFLLKRDVLRCVNKRFFLLLLFIAGFQAWFILGSGSVEKVLEAGRMNFMAIVFSFNFFGALVALALTFDSISRERQNKVLDLVLTSGLTKRTVILSKTAMNLIVSLALSVLYVVLVALIYFALGAGGAVALMCLAYIPAITAFNFIYCMLGLMLSIFLRSSKTSFIVSMAIGLLCMPRLLVTFLEGVANALGLGTGLVEWASMASPALIMNALGGGEGVQKSMIGICFLAFYVIMMIWMSVIVFQKQDELNYGE